VSGKTWGMKFSSAFSSYGHSSVYDAAPGTVSALLRRYLLATHFDGLSSDF